jgi:hypothetical protein
MSVLATLILRPQDHFSAFFNLSPLPFNEDDLEKLEKDRTLARANTKTGVAAGASANPVEELKYQSDFETTYSNRCNAGTWDKIKRYLDFTPGNYEYVLSGRFSVCPVALPGSDSPECPAPTRSFVQTSTFQIGIDQTRIIFFAVLGGFLAYLVVSVRGPDGPVNEFFAMLTAGGMKESFVKAVSKDGFVACAKILRDLFGTAILSAAFTIITSRLSEGQFPIKVSVLDGWGATTIGFLSYFAGTKFIDSLRNLVAGPQAANAKADAPKPAPTPQPAIQAIPPVTPLETATPGTAAVEAQS